MKSIFLVNQFYWPDRAATAQLLQDLAEDLADAGHAVTMLAGRGAYALEDGMRLKWREWRVARRSSTKSQICTPM